MWRGLFLKKLRSNYKYWFSLWGVYSHKNLSGFLQHLFGCHCVRSFSLSVLINWTCCGIHSQKEAQRKSEGWQYFLRISAVQMCFFFAYQSFGEFQNYSKKQELYSHITWVKKHHLFHKIIAMFAKVTVQNFLTRFAWVFLNSCWVVYLSCWPLLPNDSSTTFL